MSEHVIRWLGIVPLLVAPACASAPAPRASGAEAAILVDETATCRGVDEHAATPLPADAEIAAVVPLHAPITGFGTIDQPRLRGAELIVPARPGLTKEWAQRVVECKLPASALAVPGVRASVRSLGDAFAVDVTANDWATSEEILRRSRELAQR